MWLFKNVINVVYTIHCWLLLLSGFLEIRLIINLDFKITLSLLPFDHECTDTANIFPIRYRTVMEKWIINIEVILIKGTTLFVLWRKIFVLTVMFGFYCFQNKKKCLREIAVMHHNDPCYSNGDYWFQVYGIVFSLIIICHFSITVLRVKQFISRIEVHQSNQWQDFIYRIDIKTLILFIFSHY